MGSRAVNRAGIHSKALRAEHVLSVGLSVRSIRVNSQKLLLTACIAAVCLFALTFVYEPGVNVGYVNQRTNARCYEYRVHFAKGRLILYRGSLWTIKYGWPTDENPSGVEVNELGWHIDWYNSYEGVWHWVETGSIWKPRIWTDGPGFTDASIALLIEIPILYFCVMSAS